MVSAKAAPVIAAVVFPAIRARARQSPQDALARMIITPWERAFSGGMLAWRRVQQCCDGTFRYRRRRPEIQVNSPSSCASSAGALRCRPSRRW